MWGGEDRRCLRLHVIIISNSDSDRKSAEIIALLLVVFCKRAQFPVQKACNWTTKWIYCVDWSPTQITANNRRNLPAQQQQVCNSSEVKKADFCLREIAFDMNVIWNGNRVIESSSSSLERGKTVDVGENHHIYNEYKLIRTTAMLWRFLPRWEYPQTARICIKKFAVTVIPNDKISSSMSWHSKYTRSIACALELRLEDETRELSHFMIIYWNSSSF